MAVLIRARLSRDRRRIAESREHARLCSRRGKQRLANALRHEYGSAWAEVENDKARMRRLRRSETRSVAV